MKRFRLCSLTGALVLMLAVFSLPVVAKGGPPGGEEAGNLVLIAPDPEVGIAHVVADALRIAERRTCVRADQSPVAVVDAVLVAFGGTVQADGPFWSYSGKTPCVGSGHSMEGAEDDGEAARWRSSSFVAVSGPYVAFKAVSGKVVGLYLNKQPGQDLVTVLDTQTGGQALDPEAPPGSTVTEVGIEREGLRGDWLAVSAKMEIEGGTEEEGMAGIYVTRLPRW